MNRIIWCFLGLFLLFWACSDREISQDLDPDDVGNDWDIVIGSSKDRPGIGNAEGQPLGETFSLPDGIELVTRPFKSFDPDLGLLYGSLNTFYADLSFVNRGDTTIQLEIPSGLICLFRHEGKTQNGILTSAVRIAIPPTYGGVSPMADTTTIYLGLGCLNYSMAFPWEENQETDTRDYPIGKNMYMPSVITSDVNIRKLLDLLKDYPKLRLTRHYNPQDTFEPDYELPEWQKIYVLIQDALWDITDGHGLTRKDYRTLLEALKNYK
ncbi:hypothetical protein [Olivibacter sitiensis]|uniref:hypothetical protein n=1 Tax=Olivibacter sitiensis TaxID=376470 RepID=UPI0012FA3789|nr:hypothetical protein [Olivibacter sitiensis]